MFRNLFTHPPRLPLIAPSILSADFAAMGAECSGVLYGSPTPPPREVRSSSMLARKKSPDPAHADLLHVDVMDGHFVPNLTMGPDMVKALRRALPEAFLDVHLMVTDPWLHAQAFAKAGADHITFHVEVVPPDQIGPLAQRIRQLDAAQGAVSVGLAINPPTPVEAVLPHLGYFDLLLVMSVNPGFSGQAFIPEVLTKVRRVGEELTPTQRLQMDGGISAENAGICQDAGCDVLVAASAIFGKPTKERGAVITALRSPPNV
ncbi:MAG: ribulose-phosphate 3-epimerase [Phycisphaerales bacterium]